MDLGGEGRHAADGVDGEDGEEDDHGHFEDELDEVSPEDGPEAGDGVVSEGEGEADEDSGELAADGGDAESEGEDLAHGEVDPAHDDGIDGEGEVEGAEGAEEGGGGAGVAKFGEFHVSEDAGAAPERGEEKTVSMPERQKDHQSQLPAMPWL